MLASIKRKLAAHFIKGTLKGWTDSDKATTGIAAIVALEILRRVDIEKLLAADVSQVEMLGAAIAVAVFGYLTNRKKREAPTR